MKLKGNYGGNWRKSPKRVYGKFWATGNLEEMKSRKRGDAKIYILARRIDQSPWEMAHPIRAKAQTPRPIPMSLKALKSLEPKAKMGENTKRPTIKAAGRRPSSKFERLKSPLQKKGKKRVSVLSHWKNRFAYWIPHPAWHWALSAHCFWAGRPLTPLLEIAPLST